MQDLLGLREPLDLTFAPDALDGFSFDTSNAFRIDARLGPQYRAAAESLAERAASNDSLYGHLVPCSPNEAGCRDRFLKTFGERAFRRPLTAEDLQELAALFDAAAVPSPDGDPFREGVRRTLSAMLQSPELLYRIELGRGNEAGGRVPLDDFEVAARLSYFLYDSMPDLALFELARAGQLRTPDQVEVAARRMLAEPRALERLVAFHEQLWHFDRFARISPDAATYPDLPNRFVNSVRHAARLFVRDILMTGGGLSELLTAPYAYADAGLRKVYGVPPVGERRVGAAPAAELLRVSPASRFARVDFDPTQRKGLLMQAGYLASNAYSVRTDPIHRGLFVIRDLLCRDIPDPPPGATTTPPPDTDQPIVTTRDEVNLVTGQSFCPTCHTEINAPGFAFEGFDAIGQQRTKENGAPVDTAAQLVLDGRVVHFAGPVELVEQLARSAEAHRCYSQRWLEFAYGRPLAESDVPTLDRIAAASLPIADMIVAIVRSPEFLSVPVSAPAAQQGRAP